MSHPQDLALREQARLIATGELDPDELLDTTLARIEERNGVSVPAGFHSSGLPIGLQLLAPWGEEARLLDAAGRIEQASDRRWVDAAPTR